MKKYAWIVALLLALSLTFVFVSCDDKAKDKDKDGEEEDGWVHNLGAKTLDLIDNFQYGKGYQGVGKWTELFAGNKIAVGDEYYLKITFTASRDLTDLLYVGLVDTTPAANYWKELTWPGDPEKPALIPGAAEDNIIKKDEEVTFEVKFTATAAATSASADANTIVFMTDSTDGTPGTANSGTLGTIKLTFTEFLFGNKELDSEEPPPPPELYVPNPVVAEEDYTVKLEGLVMKNAEATTAAYNNLWFDLSEAFPAGFDISKYNAFTVKAKFYDADGEEITLANNLGQLNFATGSNPWGGQGVWLNAANYPNLGTATEEVALLEGPGFFDLTPKFLYAQNSVATVKFIEITEITFHWGTRKAAPAGPPDPVTETIPTGMKEAFRLDKTDKGDSTIWNWEETPTGDFLKGRIQGAMVTQIMALTTGKVQIYWVSSDGTDIPANTGIGNFAGFSYNSANTAAVAGMAEGNISALTPIASGDNAGQLDLNTYNNGGVVKIIFYEPES